jgi:hypothetical protein
MGKKGESSPKEINKLWWEYLKRSKDYQEYCNWVKEHREKFPLRLAQDPRIQQIDPTSFVENFHPLPTKFENDKHGRSHPIRDGHSLFGDIYTCSFEKWWDSNKRQLELKSIEDYSEVVASEIQHVINEFDEEMLREPTLQEFKEWFVQYMKRPMSRHIYITIRIRDGQSNNELVKQFSSYIRNDKKMLMVKKKARKWSPTHPVRFDELKRYLEVYDLSAKTNPELSWREIAAVIHPRKNFHDEIRRILIKEKHKAERIIKNAEQGIFPSKY